MSKLNIAIDFGNSNIKAAVITNNKIKEVTFNNGNINKEYIENIIYYDKNEILLGFIAKNKVILNEDYENIIYGIKQQLEDRNWKKYINNLQIEKSSIDVVADILQQIVEKIQEKNAKKEIENCVITVPVNFSELQKEKIRKACKKINLPLKALISEPVAGALNLLDIDDIEDEQNIIVFDFGGGTLDIVLANVSNYDKLEFKVLGTVGVNYGGKYINELILKECILPELEDISILDEFKYRNAILIEIEKAKISCLGAEQEDEYCIILQDTTFDNKISTKTISLEREKLEYIVQESNLKEIIFEMFDYLLENEGLEKEEIQKVCAIGGSSQLLLVQDIISEYFDDEDIFDKDDIDEDEIYLSVVLGAGKYLQQLLNSGEDIYIENKNSYDLIAKKNIGEVIVLSKDVPFTFETQLRRFKTISIDEKDKEAILYQRFKTFGNDKNDLIVIGKVMCDKEKYSNYIYYSFVVDEYGKIKCKFYDDSNLIEETKIILED